MIKLTHEKELDGLKLDETIKSIARNTLKLLDEAYGEDRNIHADLGGFLVILELEDDVHRLKDYHLNIEEDNSEYTDYIAGETDNWIIALYLLSSDYSITVIAPMYLAPLEMLRTTEQLLDTNERYHV